MPLALLCLPPLSYLLSLPGLTCLISMFLAGQQVEGAQQGAGPNGGLMEVLVMPLRQHFVILSLYLMVGWYLMCILSLYIYMGSWKCICNNLVYGNGCTCNCG